MLSKQELKNLDETADLIRANCLRTIAHLGVGHVGGSMSVVDILTLLYYKEMNVNPKEPRMKGRDLLVLSKGHSGPALYSVLAEKGFFPKEWLNTLNQGGTNLPSHCDRNRTPGIDMTTGSLGQGLSAACGMALAGKIDKTENRVFAIIGDGETDEGQNWEAAMFASQFSLSNLIAFTDYNKLQIDGTTAEVMDLGDIEGKCKSFGWQTYRCKGHDMEAMHECIEKARTSDKPTMIILDTIKGYKVSIAENKVSNHNMPLTPEQAEQAVSEIVGRN